MPCQAQLKDWFDYFVALAPPSITALIAAFVAWVAYQQWRTNTEKLRLDLYNRRFDVYAQTLAFYQALVIYDPAFNGDDFRRVRADFIKACRESRFLFDKESTISSIMNKMLDKSYVVSGFKETAKDMANADTEAFSKMSTESHDTLMVFGISIEKLENALAPYLNFHKLVA